MSGHETYFVTATLAPRSDTATLLRILSVLHSKGTQVRELTFASADVEAATVVALVTSGNTGRDTLERAFNRMIDVVAVTTDPA